MGGCKCAYRTCKARSDGKTHLFHFPVFDRVRCHKWLVNCRRLDFLNLTVSQLKNRVVCQHHFEDHNFNNEMKDKLTFKAVPTLNGPYYDSADDDQSDSDQVFPISEEHIEKQEPQTHAERKKTFTVKYVDFLTNCDTTDDDEKPKIIKIEKPQNSLLDFTLPFTKTVKTSPRKAEPRVKILSEQKIQAPRMVALKSKLNLKPIDPTNILLKANNKENTTKMVANTTKMLANVTKIPDITSNMPAIITKIPANSTMPEDVTKLPANTTKIPENTTITPESVKNKMPFIDFEIPPIDVPKEEATQNEMTESKTVKTFNTAPRLNLKRKIDATAIAEKRKFNMKLKEAIGESLLKAKEDTLKLKVMDNLATEQSLPDVKELSLKYIDDRMNRMERLFMNTIHANTRQIQELKSMIGSSECQKCAKIDKEPDTSDPTSKKELYNKISKFLTPELNNLLFEELFINSVTKDIPTRKGLRRKKI